MSQEPRVTLLAWLSRNATLWPDRPAAQHIAADGSLAWQLSWQDYAQAVADTAQRLRARPGSSAHAILMMDPDPRFGIAFLACLQAGIASIPLPPFDPARSQAQLEQLRAIADDSGADTIVCNGASHAALAELGEQLNGFAILPLSSPPPQALALAYPPADLAPAGLTSLLYTSGSTSAPKAVPMAEHHLAYNAQTCAQAWQIDANTCLASWMPNHHSFGLVYNVLIPLQSGCTLVAMSPSAFLARPRLWFETIQAYACSHSAAASFGYQYCVDRIADLADLDLSSWRVALISAEPVRRGTCEAFLSRFAPIGLRSDVFCPLYGLSECGPITSMEIQTPLSYYQPPGLDADRGLACVGQPLPGCQIRIVDPERQEPLPLGSIGEIWLSSPALMDGYHQRPEINRHAFGQLGDKQSYFRTGDRGFMDRAGLFITGRIKELLIVRGKNYDPQDIEWSALQALSEAVRGSAAAFEDEDGTFQLVVEVSASAGELNRLADQASQGVSRQLGICPDLLTLVAPGAIPKTSSGKLRRGPCRDLLAAGTLQPLFQRAVATIAAPASCPATCLLTLFAQVLGLREADLDEGDPLSTFDLDSLTIANLSAAVADQLGKRLHPTAFFKCDTLGDLAVCVGNADDV